MVKEKAEKSTKKATIRDKVANKSKEKPSKTRKLKQTAGQVKKPFSSAKTIAKKEYYLPMPDNKADRFLNKKRSIMPKYFKEAWRELKQVEWPGRKETSKLTAAVLIFALVFGVIIALVDFGLDKIFKQLLLK